MSFTPRSPEPSSTGLQSDRPIVPRQRSNSLPIGITALNAQEAGLLFSAAEKATARRRRNFSICHTPNWPLPKDSPMEVEEISWPLPSNSTIRQSTFKSHSLSESSLQVPRSASEAGTRGQRLSKAPKGLIIDQVSSRRSVSSPTFAYADQLFKSLPVDPVSPNRRQVPTHSLKSYADGLFQFTQVRLVSAVPQVQIQLPSPPPSGFFDNELASSDAHAAPLETRPSLESKFSDWSVNSFDTTSRRESLAVQTPPTVQIDPTLMSPDSFFGGYDDSVVIPVADFSHLRSDAGYASSATYEPPQEPKGQSPAVQKRSRPVEEVSYFTNYQRFLEPDSKSQQEPLLEPPTTLNIDLSPLEQFLSPATPPQPLPKRSRAGTAVRQPVIARSFSSGRFAHSTPTTPYQIAEVAYRVPAYCVGAIG